MSSTPFVFRVKWLKLMKYLGGKCRNERYITEGKESGEEREDFSFCVGIRGMAEFGQF